MIAPACFSLATTVASESATYELTAWGYGLDDVLLAMARWGSQSAAAAGHELSPAALLIAMRTTYEPASLGDAAGQFELHIGDESFVVVTGQGSITVAAGRVPAPDAVIWSDPAVLRAVIFGDRTLADALRSGALRIDGDDDTAAALLASFRRPRLATTAEPEPRRTAAGAQQPARRSDR
jgi:putative sterol carrier protein